MIDIYNNSVLNSSAHSTKLCAVNNSGSANIYSKVEHIITSVYLSIIDKLLIHILFTYGSRVSAVLKLHTSYITQQGVLYMPQDKKSEPLIINDSFSKSILKQYYGTSIELYKGISRFYYYRLLIRLGLYEEFESNIKKSVTHLGRHLYNLQFKEIEADKQIKINALGHKNLANKKYYEKQIKTQKIG